MIDEELYQQAADELNSDRRRPHVWARACALSKDDHDEARYLYTNLRVEELIAERDSGSGSTETLNSFEELTSEITLEAVEDTPPTGVLPLDNTSDFPADSTLLMSDLSSATVSDDTNLQIEEAALLQTEDATLLQTDDASLLQTENASLFQTDDASLLQTNDASLLQTEDASLLQTNDASLLQTEDASLLQTEDASLIEADALLEKEPLPEEFDSLTSELSPVEREYYEKHPEQLKELEEENFIESLHRGNEDLDALLKDDNEPSSLIYDDDENALTAEFRDATRTQAVYVEDKMDWLEDGQNTATENTNLQRLAPQEHQPQNETDRFTQDLMRQADDLPGQHSDIVASETPSYDDETTWQPSARANVAAVGTAASIGASRYGTRSEQTLPIGSTGSTNSSRLPIDITDGKSGTEYCIFQRDKKVQTVKKGVSWTALFFTIPYLIYRHMFGTAIVYTIMSLIILAGLIFMGLSWIDAGAGASDFTKLVTAGFALLAFIGILYVPFRNANAWRAEKLERRGFELVAHVKAKNPGKAVALARRAAALD